MDVEKKVIVCQWKHGTLWRYNEDIFSPASFETPQQLLPTLELMKPAFTRVNFSAEMAFCLEKRGVHCQG
jgi:hypothetical protein